MLGKTNKKDAQKTGFKIYQDMHIKKLQVMSTTTLDHYLFHAIRRQLLYISQTTSPEVSYSAFQVCHVKMQQTTGK